MAGTRGAATTGTGVVQDATLAAQWWQLAAEAGDAIPQYRRGNRDAAAALLRLGAN